MEPLEDYRQSVRRRPGMYIGGTGPVGQMDLVLELVGNAVDLVLQGKAQAIEVSLHDDGSVEISDDGPGLDLSNPVVRGWFADGHQGPTADGHYPHVHLNSWGGGAAVVNFLSSRFRLASSFAGDKRVLEWTDGGSRCSAVSTTTDDGAGTTVRFWRDPMIFERIDLPLDRMTQRLRDLACLIPGARISLDGHHWVFDRWDTGLAMLAGDNAAHAAARSTATIDGLDISIGMVLVAQDQTVSGDHLVYANYRHMSDKGPFTEALDHGLADIEATTSTHERVAVVSLTMLDPTIGGPTRCRLDDPRATRALEEFFDQHGPTLRSGS